MRGNMVHANLIKRAWSKKKQRFLQVYIVTEKMSRQPIKCQCCLLIETSQLICYANQLTGFYMRTTLAFNGLSFSNKQ